MRRSIALLWTALAAAAVITGPVRASEPTGSFLGDYHQSGGLWGIPAPGSPNTLFSGGIRTEYLDREVTFNSGDISFAGFRIGPELTFGYKKWFVTGSYLHSVVSEDVGSDETQSFGYNAHAGYATSVGKNLVIAPVVGYSGEFTRFESKSGSFDSTEGLHGVNFGFLLGWTPPYVNKPFPKWQVNFSFLYYPSLSVTDDFGSQFSGDEGWSLSLGSRYNFTQQSSLYAGFTYRELNASDRFVDVKVRDWSAGLTFTYKFGAPPSSP